MSTSRVEIADHVGDVFGGGAVSKQQLVSAARARGASAEVLTELHRLPDGQYRDLRSLWPHMPGLPRGA